LTVEFLAPLVCGVKSICTRQLAPIATVLPIGHVVPDGATAKFAASGPVKVTWDRVSAALPRFRRVIGWGPLVVPTARVPKMRDAGKRFAIGEAATPVPERAITCLAALRPPELSRMSISA
jgi:hypothetical protein